MWPEIEGRVRYQNIDHIRHIIDATFSFVFEGSTVAMFADRLQEIAPFRVMELMERAKLLESRGERVVHFEVGEPDFATAPSVIAAGQRALADGHTKYTQALGLPELRAADCRVLQAERWRCLAAGADCGHVGCQRRTAVAVVRCFSITTMSC